MKKNVKALNRQVQGLEDVAGNVVNSDTFVSMTENSHVALSC